MPFLFRLDSVLDVLKLDELQLETVIGARLQMTVVYRSVFDSQV